ncbi:MAG: hypothetical protein IJX36_08375, partial [Thermoguttaceae bacterium]|nr:hypothetical protein [Thermoguttaceae bacterium]
RERTEDQPAFEAASTSRLSDEAEESASSEFDAADFDAESEPRSKKRRSKKRRRDGESAEDGDDGGPAASAN